MNTASKGILIQPGPYTAAQGGQAQNVDARYLHVYVNVSVLGTGTITPTIQGWADVAGGGTAAYTLLAGAAINALGLTVLKVGPGLTATTNLVANDMVPLTWGVAVAKSDTSAWNFSVTFALGT